MKCTSVIEKCLWYSSVNTNWKWMLIRRVDIHMSLLCILIFTQINHKKTQSFVQNKSNNHEQPFHLHSHVSAYIPTLFIMPHRRTDIRARWSIQFQLTEKHLRRSRHGHQWCSMVPTWTRIHQHPITILAIAGHTTNRTEHRIHT